MLRRPPRSTRTDTLFPDTTLVRSGISDIAGDIKTDDSLRTKPARDSLPAAQVIAIANDSMPDEKDTVAEIPFVRKWRSEEHTSELQSLMRISYAVFCLKKTQIHPRTLLADAVHRKNEKHTTE